MRAKLTSTLFALLVCAIPVLPITLCASLATAQQHEHGANHPHGDSGVAHSHDSGAHQHTTPRSTPEPAHHEDGAPCCRHDIAEPGSALADASSAPKPRQAGVALSELAWLSPSDQLPRASRMYTRAEQRSPYVRTRVPLLI